MRRIFIVASVVFAVTVTCALQARATVIVTNPSFEVDTFDHWPGNVTENFPITGWDVILPDWAGINNSSIPYWGYETMDAHPFLQGQTPPDGLQAAYLQYHGQLSQSVSGFEVGTTYTLSYYEAGRKEGTVASPYAKVGTEYVVPEHAMPYTGTFTLMTGTFTATAETMTLVLGGGDAFREAGDCAINYDLVAITSVPEPSTLSLLGVGLAGLLAYAWRKRR